jgi:hypothetical protein
MNREKLSAIFERQLPNGTYVYDDAQVREVLPALFLLSGDSLDSVTNPALKKLMVEFCQKLQLDPGVSQDELTRKAAAYFREHPPNPTLLRELQESSE